MIMPLSELADRYSILRLKIERMHQQDNAFVEQFAIFTAELNTELDKVKNGNRAKVEECIRQLYIINGHIWNLEFDIRSGKIGEANLEEVGRRALKIREYNAKRLEQKNMIARLSSNMIFFDIKVDHASAPDDNQEGQ